jgi:hypothetical protein
MQALVGRQCLWAGAAPNRELLGLLMLQRCRNLQSAQCHYAEPASIAFNNASSNIRDMVHFAPPAYLTSGDVSAIKWLADQPGTGVVLARWDLSPFVASRGHPRVVVGHWLWTHQYAQRRKEVEAISGGPRSLLQTEHVAWVLIDEDRGVPAWAMGLEPATHFDQTVVLPAGQLLAHLEDATMRAK